MTEIGLEASMCTRSSPMGPLATLISIFLGGLAFLCTILSLCTDCWQVNSKGSVVLSVRCRGLWGECVWDKFVKIWTCDVFSSYLNPHPVAIITTRTSIILSAIVGTGAFLCLLFGCRYFTCLGETKAKRRCLCLSVGFYLLAGLLSCVGVIRYGVYVLSQHRHEVSLRIPGFPSFEYGYSLWMAVAGLLASFLTAVASWYEVKLLQSPEVNLPQKAAGNGPRRACTYV